MKKVILGLLMLFSGIMMVDADTAPSTWDSVNNILVGEEYTVGAKNHRLFDNNEARFYYTNDTLEFIEGNAYCWDDLCGASNEDTCTIKKIDQGVLSVNCTNKSDADIGIHLKFKAVAEGEAKVGVGYDLDYYKDLSSAWPVAEINVIKKDGLCSCDNINNNKCDEQVKCEMECDPCPELDNTSLEKTNREKNILIGSLTIIVVVELIVIAINLIKKKNK